ncbi:hypothetical protein GCM10008915_36800 [Bifidobacterium pullorum subsp. gallinarum]
MTKLNVPITQNYRLVTDATDRAPATQFILQRRHIVDPTKSPAYTPEEHASPPPVRETWKDDGYYPLNAGGLSYAIQTAVLRGTDVSNAKSIGEALGAYQAETARLAEVINACLTPNISGDIGALGVR